MFAQVEALWNIPPNLFSSPSSARSLGAFTWFRSKCEISEVALLDPGAPRTGLERLLVTKLGGVNVGAVLAFPCVTSIYPTRSAT